MHFDFTTPKGFKITISIEKKYREESKKRKIREWSKKTKQNKNTDIRFNVYIVYFGG